MYCLALKLEYIKGVKYKCSGKLIAIVNKAKITPGAAIDHWLNPLALIITSSLSFNSRLYTLRTAATMAIGKIVVRKNLFVFIFKGYGGGRFIPEQILTALFQIP